MKIVRCADVTLPPYQCINTGRFGLPAGTAGRDGNEIEGYLIHCTSLSLEDMLQCRNGVGRLNRADESLRQSYHYYIDKNGTLVKDVDEADTAWGLRPSLPNGCGTDEVTYEDCDLNLDWDVIRDNPTILPDYLLLHIALEKGPIGGNDSQGSIDSCGCNAPQNSKLFTKAQYKTLINLLAEINARLTPIDGDNLRFVHNIDCCERNECGCSPCESELLCAVSNFCKPANAPLSVAFTPGAIVELTGADDTTQQVTENASDFLLRLLVNDSGAIKVRTATGLVALPTS